MDQMGDQEITWNSQLEEIISDEGERSLCFQWLHIKSEKLFSRLSTYLTLPVIILSTVAGSASIGSQSLFADAQAANIIIGCISLSVATLNTVGSYFGWTKRSESHRIASLTYGKVYRFILIELALPRHQRMSPKDMLKVVREQCDRLQEMSPQIPDVVIAEFKRKFGESTPDVKKPEITNGLDPIIVHSTGAETPLLLIKPENLGKPSSPARALSKTSIADHTPSNLQMLS
jgi:hypothetical protein